MPLPHISFHPLLSQLAENIVQIPDIPMKLPLVRNEEFPFCVKISRNLPFEIDTNARPEEKEDFNADISGVRILLVEDNELNAEIAEFILTENGAKVETVKNGLEAVQHFEACESGTYDVILMDVMMPVMDGLTATKTIRSLERQDAKTIPIIAMTANAFREDAERCMEAGMNAHLSKPIVIEEVIKTILRYVHND